MPHIESVARSRAICGLVLTLAGDLAERAAAVARLRGAHDWTVGEPVEARLPLVIEVSGRDELLAQWQRLLDTPGVIHLSLAYVGYDQHLSRGEQR